MTEILKDIAAIRKIDAVTTILDVVCKTTGMGFAAVARVTDTRWVACAVLDKIQFGLAPGGELPLETTICNDIRALRQEVVIDNVAEDPVYRSHHTPATYGFQSYISVPIIMPDGNMFGTLCAIDPHPRNLKNSGTPGMFRLFAQLIAFHLDAIQQLSDAQSNLRNANAELENTQFSLAASQADLRHANGASELREQFIAVLGHDLRNPIAAIEGGRQMLSKRATDPRDQRVLRLMGESVNRMTGLINNLMDFARGRLGGGIGLERTKNLPLEPVLAQIVNEIKAGHPERQIDMTLDVALPLNVDHARIAQMFSNLLGNAITHGADDEPILVEAGIEDGQFNLAVANGGQPIPSGIIEKLFQPFQRGSGDKAYRA